MCGGVPSFQALGLWVCLRVVWIGVCSQLGETPSLLLPILWCLNAVLCLIPTAVCTAPQVFQMMTSCLRSPDRWCIRTLASSGTPSARL